MAHPRRSILPATATSKPDIIISRSAEETSQLGREIAAALVPGSVLYLIGDLGSGKTTLVQGIVRGFGIDQFARSSSFVIANEYFSPVRKMPVYHMDLYRLEGEDLEGIGLEEYLFGRGVCLIEWADRLRITPSKNAWEIRMSWEGEFERKIEIRKLA